MTREEQIIQGAKDFLPHITNAQLTLFAAGAMWADENLREGLIDIEKALEFILNYDANDYLEEIADFGVYQLNEEKVKTAFYKAMGENKV